MYLVGSDCQGLESVVILERKGGQAFARAECIRQLRDGEDALVVLPLPFLLAEVGEKAQIVVFCGDGSTLKLKLAFVAMPVQD